jgi:hypothetical protein
MLAIQPKNTVKSHATLAYIDSKGTMYEIKLDLKRDADLSRLQKTVYWAVCNGVEIRVRPNH